MNKLALITFFLMALINSFATAFADMAMGSTGNDANTTTMESVMVPFHIAQIIISVIVSIYIFILIRNTGQLSKLIYLFIAMIFFLISAIISYLPHLGLMQDLIAQITRLILTTLSLALIGVTLNLSILPSSKAGS